MWTTNREERHRFGKLSTLPKINAAIKLKSSEDIGNATYTVQINEKTVEVNHSSILQALSVRFCWLQHLGMLEKEWQKEEEEEQQEPS